MSMVEIKRFNVDGYLTGGLGLKVDGSSYIYLMFSSGDIILIDGMNFKQIA